VILDLTRVSAVAGLYSDSVDLRPGLFHPLQLLPRCPLCERRWIWLDFRAGLHLTSDLQVIRLQLARTGLRLEREGSWSGVQAVELQQGVTR
jgi:hypothetical protein